MAPWGPGGRRNPRCLGALLPVQHTPHTPHHHTPTRTPLPATYPTHPTTAHPHAPPHAQFEIVDETDCWMDNEQSILVSQGDLEKDLPEALQVQEREGGKGRGGRGEGGGRRGLPAGCA